MWGCRGWPPPKGLGLTPFRRVFVGFVGEVYLHERVILKSGIDGASVVLTPDHGCYVEEHQTDRDITKVRVLGDESEMPYGIGGRQLYRFQMAPALNDWILLLREAETIAQMYPAKFPAVAGAAPAAPPAPPAPPAHPVLPAPLAPPAPPAAAAVVAATAPAAPPGLPPAAIVPMPGAQQVWRASEEMEAIAGHATSRKVEFGDKVLLGPNDVVLGDKAVVVLADGRPCFAMRTNLAKDDFKTERIGKLADDARTLPAKFNVRGQLQRDFTDAVAQMMEEAAQEGWPVSGPRTLPLLESYTRMGCAPRQHRQQWVTQANIPKEDRSRYERETLCALLDIGSTYDQLNMPSLACMELASRRVQLIEDARRLNPSAPSYEGANYFMGSAVGDQGAIVVSALSSHVASRLQADASVAKERRKQREERALAKAPPKKS